MPGSQPVRSPGRSLSIGAGSAYANDRPAPAAAMAESGHVSYIGFNCLAERTMALAHVRRRRDERIRSLVPVLRSYLAGGGKVVGNLGAANPAARRRPCVPAPMPSPETSTTSGSTSRG
ncbi:acyclic terpene utilization AtuA family protein [Streptosporangium sp. NPDC005286]|uniref:acyclic terpene utilization AtuA family protein n=1 Tax=Streptosporangium sp. NPDC005286 TaxID=3154463 RepID=UPI0033A0A9E3